MLKVIQWGTGATGKLTAKAVQKASDLELVGCYTTSAHKNGRDVGDICGTSPMGVKATTSREDIFAMPADCVLYMTMEEFTVDRALGDICRLLSSGKNVIATAATILFHPKAIGQEAVDRLEAACREGGTSYFGTGIEPGWASVTLPLLISGIVARIDSILIQEILDYRAYATTASMFDMMGFGAKPPEPQAPMSMSLHQAAPYSAPLMMLADALGFTIDNVIFESDVAVAERDLEVAAGRIAAGTVSAKHYAFTAMVDGKPKVKIEHFTRAGDPGPIDWPLGQGFYITIRGEPSMKLSVDLALHGNQPTDDGALIAAMHVVHAIEPVCAAPVGIRSVLDLPPIIGRGVMTRRL